MKEQIRKMREENGGFTLAELLVVVAIIAVLVAIAVPVFTSSLDRANAATDEANIRSGYAQSQTYCLTKYDSASPANKIATNDKYYLTTSGTLEKTATNAYVTKGVYSNVDNRPTWMPEWEANKKITYTFTVATDGTVTCATGME